MHDILKFYLDTHIDKQVAIQLRDKGVDVVRCQEVGLADADDELHLTYASHELRVLVTFDKGFRDRGFEWLAAGKTHSGIMICNRNLQQGGIGVIVMTCLFYHEMVQEGAATPHEFENKVFDIE